MSSQGPDTEILYERYARALIDAAGKQGNADAAEAGLQYAAGLLAKNRGLEKVLYNPGIDKKKKIGLIKTISERSGLGKDVCSFLGLLIKRNRFDCIQGILLKYKDLNARKKGRLHVLVKTASALSNNQQERLKKVLAKAFDKEVLIDEILDPALLGGLEIRVGSLIYNTSLSQKIGQIKERLSLV